MPIINLNDAPTTRARIRDGEGECIGVTAFTADDFASKVMGVGMTIIPPGASIGDHPHGNEEEVYAILSGEGVATLDGAQQRVRPGDIMLNAPGGTHGLVNDGSEDLVLFAFAASVD